MTTITAIRDGIQARLETIAGLRVFDEFPAGLSVSGSASAAVIEFGDIDFDEAMSGQGDGLTFTITMLAAKTGTLDRIGRAKIDGYLDPTNGSATSVRHAVNGTLGGVVAFARVASAQGYGEYTVGVGDAAAGYIGVQFTVAVIL